MLKIKRALKQDRLLRSLTGLNLQAFEALLLAFNLIYEEKQKLHYSGKKNRHTRKHLAGVDKDKRVLILSRGREGKLHDKRFHDEEDLVGGIPDEIPILVDLGFQGMQKQYVNIYLPHKKPKGGELTTEQKQENQQLSKKRVLCENAFAGVKRYNAIAHIYRNRVTDFDDKLMLTACGLWNFYCNCSLQ